MVPCPAREATLAPSRAFSSGESWLCSVHGGLPSSRDPTSPHPAPGSPPLVGAQNMQLLLHPSPHYPITFAPFILARFPESFSYLQTLSNVHLRNFFHSFQLQNIVTHYFASYTAYCGCKRMKEIRSGQCHRPTICIFISDLKNNDNQILL